jgi:hypothetical protein
LFRRGDRLSINGDLVHHGIRFLSKLGDLSIDANAARSDEVFTSAPRSISSLR